LNDDDDDLDIPAESRISKTLSEKTIKTVIILVLCLLFLLPVCQIETYEVGQNVMHENGLLMLR